MKAANITSLLILTSLFCMNQSKAAVEPPEEPGEIHGNVTDVDSGEPLPGANVFLEDTDYGAAADREGHFHISNVPPGTYSLKATMIGYRTYRAEVQIIGGEVVKLNIALETAPLMGEEIVVTGTKSIKIIKDVPVRTAVITLEKIEEKGATNLYEALENEPGIRVEQQCSNCNFSTVRVAGLEGQYTQTLIDGQPIFSGLAGVYGLQQLQAGNIERIEVVKGSGSALYGSDAIGGIINVIMKEPALLPSINAGMSLGSYGTDTFHIDGSQRRGNIGMVFSAQKDMTDEIDMTGGAGAPFLDVGKDGFTDRVKTDNFGASTKFYLYDPMGEQSRLWLSGRVLSESRQGGFLKTWDDPFDPSSEQIKTLRYETGINLDKTFSRGDMLKFDANYVAHDREATNGAAWDKPIEADVLDENLNFTNEGWDYIRENDFNRFREDWYPKPFIVDEALYLADITYSTPLAGHDLLTGLQFRKSNLSQNISGEKSDKHAADVGVYLQGDLDLRPELEMIAGLRYDLHDSYDGLTDNEYHETALNPRVAVRYSLTDEITLRGNVGSGFRVPYLFAEDLHLCASAPRIFKGKDLRAEKSVSLSLGADLYRKTFRAGASIFRVNVKDKIVFVSPGDKPIPAGYDFQYINMGEAYTEGLELSVGGLALDYLLNYDANLVYTDARFREPRYTLENYTTDNDGWKYSDRIPRSPSWTGNLSFTLKPRAWSINLSMNYTGGMYIDHCPGGDESRLIIEGTDPFVTVNSRVTRKIKESLELFLGARNLFDYTQPKRDITDAAYIYAPLYGRLIYSGFNLSIK